MSHINPEKINPGKNSAQPLYNTQDDISFLDLIAFIWRAKIAIIAGIVFAVFIGQVFIQMSVQQYKADILITPADRKGGPDVKALLPDNSSFAIQYLVNSIGSQDSNDFVRFVNIAQGQTVAAQLLLDKRIVDGLAKDRRFTFSKAQNIENSAQLSAYLEKEIDIQGVGNSVLHRITYYHPDAAFAAYFLTQLHAVTDEIISNDILKMTMERIAYLQDIMQESYHPDHRRALTSLLMEQEHVLMILNMDEPFAASIAEPAATGPKPDQPKEMIVIIASIFLGAFIGGLFFAVRRQNHVSGDISEL